MCTAPATGIKDPSMSQEIWRNLHCQHSQEEVNVAVSKWQPIEYLDCSLISKLSLSDYMALLLYHFSVLIVILSLFEDVCIYLKNTIEKRQEDLPFIYFLPNRTGLLECRNQELYPCHPCGEQEPKHLGYRLLSSRHISRKQDQKYRVARNTT